MTDYDLSSVIEILQIAIAPVVLISGVGLVILSQTNRMVHVIDRIRLLLTVEDPERHGEVREQIVLLYARARMIRVSLISLLMCIFFDSLVILEIFLSKIFDFGSGILTTLLFFVSIACLILGLFTFLLDVDNNLKAVKIEIDHRERAQLAEGSD